MGMCVPDSGSDDNVDVAKMPTCLSTTRVLVQAPPGASAGKRPTRSLTGPSGAGHPIHAKSSRQGKHPTRKSWISCF